MPQGFGREMLDAPRQSYTDDFWTWANSAMSGSNAREYQTVAGNDYDREPISYDPIRTVAGDAGETPAVPVTADLPSGAHVPVNPGHLEESNLLWWALIGLSVFLLATKRKRQR